MKQKLMLFSYDFPHFKTQQILTRLFAEGYQISYVIAAPWQKLLRPESPLRDAPSYTGMTHTRILCERFGVEYVVAPHSSEDAQKFISKHPVDFGIIAGAQIIRPEIIRLFSRGGIINTHEAMLPWIRGLDTLKWSVLRNLPMANSIHFIDESIDQGRLIYQERIELKPDDTMIDVSLRFMLAKPGAVVQALQKLEKVQKSELPDLGAFSGNYYRMATLEQAQKAVTAFPHWLQTYAGPAEEINPLSEPYLSIGKTQI